MLATWCIAMFASYILALVVAIVLMIFFFVMVGLEFVHKNDKNKKTSGVAGCSVLLVFLSLIPVIQKNYYV